MSIKRTVYNVIMIDPHLANDDAALIEKIWQLSGWVHDDSLIDNLRRVPPADQITRARRRLHQLGKIKYYKEVEAKRYKLFKEKTAEYSEEKGVFSWLRRR